jgi:hypothetical protein
MSERRPEILFDFEAIEVHARLYSTDDVDKLMANLIKLKPILAETIEVRRAELDKQRTLLKAELRAEPEL